MDDELAPATLGSIFLFFFLFRGGYAICKWQFPIIHKLFIEFSLMFLVYAAPYSFWDIITSGKSPQVAQVSLMYIFVASLCIFVAQAIAFRDIFSPVKGLTLISTLVGAVSILCAALAVTESHLAPLANITVFVTVTFLAVSSYEWEGHRILDLLNNKLRTMLNAQPTYNDRLKSYNNSLAKMKADHVLLLAAARDEDKPIIDKIGEGLEEISIHSDTLNAKEEGRGDDP